MKLAVEIYGLSVSGFSHRPADSNQRTDSESDTPHETVPYA